MGEVKLPSDDDGEEIAALLLLPPETSLDDLNALFSLPLDSLSPTQSLSFNTPELTRLP